MLFRHIVVRFSVVLACACAWLAPGVAPAADFAWIPPGSASYQSALSWTPNVNAPPGPADQAIFDRYADGGEGETDVTFAANATNNRMIMRDDDIRLSLGGRTYLLVNSNAGTPGLVVAELGANISNLSISGGTVETNYSTIAQATDTYGSVTVNAATWTTSQTLFIGRAGDADLFLETGAQVIAGRITIGDQADSDSIATVDGEGSMLRSAQQLVVGGAGNGELYIYEGLVRSSGAAIARDADSNGVVSLLGGSWENNGNLDIGGGNALGGIGDLIIDYDSTVTTTGRTRVWNNGLLSIRGGTLVTGSLENLGSLEYLVGVLHITNSDLTIGESGVLGSVLALTPDMHTIVDKHTTIEANASISAIQGTFASGTMTNNGRLTIVDAGMEFTGASTNTAAGRISVVDGTLATGVGAANRLTNQGKLDLLDAVVNGDLHNVAGTTITHGGAVAFNGRVTGNAQFSGGGHVTFNGRFEPNDAATSLAFGGDVSFSATNTLLMQLGGTTAGAQYDQINVVGSAAFAGTLDVALLGGFVPAAGQSFTLFEYGAHSGQFTMNLPTLPSSLTWSVNYATDALILSVGSLSTPGDLNADGVVDRADLAILVGNLGMATGATALQGDMNADAKISLADVMMLRSHWSGPGSPAAAVPEPGAWRSAIVALSALVLMRRRPV